MENFDPNIVGVHETISAYNLLLGSHVPDKRYAFWNENLLVPVTTNWEKVHYTNFFCTIDTKLRSF